MKIKLIAVLIFCIVFVKAQEWKFLTPIKTYSQVANLVVTPDQTLYMLDRSSPSGIVASSADAGITWRKLFRNGNYKDIQMLSNASGYLLKDTGIIKTTDAFQTSSFTYISATSQALFFLDNAKGFVCGYGGAVFKTTDGASTFTSISLSVNPNLNDVYFLNDNTGFVVGVNGSVYKTVNQGASWTATNLSSTSLNKILFIDANTGFIAGNNGKIFKTVDQGATWASLTSSTLYNLNDIKLISGTLYSVGQASRIVKSTDMGTVWTEQTISAYPYPDVYSVSLLGTNILTGANGYIYKSPNTTAWSTFIQGIYESNLSDISFSNTDKGVLVGNNNAYNVIYQTVDGGNTWVNKKVSFSQLYNAVDMKTTGKGLVVGSGQYFTTSDFGATWGGPYSSTPNTSLSECWLKANDDYIIGTNPGGGIGDGLILKNAAGWSQFTNISQIIKIEFYNDLLGYAGSQYGNLYKTTDGGVSWTALTSYNNFNPINKIDIISSSKVYVNDHLSTDGGSNWTTVVNPPLTYKFLTDTNGLGLNNGNVYRTTDGGANWNLIIPSTYYFNSFLYNINEFYYFPNRIIAVGDLSDIYVLDLGALSLGTDEQNQALKDVLLYPNPTDSKIFFNKPVKQEDISVFDVSGRLQLFKSVNKGIDISNLKMGVYFVKFRNGNKWITEKILKK